MTATIDRNSFAPSTIGRTLLTRCNLEPSDLPEICEGIDLHAPTTPALFGDDGSSVESMRANNPRHAIRSSLRAWRLARPAAVDAAKAKVIAAIRAAL